MILVLFRAAEKKNLVSVLRVLVALGRVVGGQRGPVDAGVVEGTAALVPAAPLHHEVTTDWSAGHVWMERVREGERENNMSIPTVIIQIKQRYKRFHFW